MPASRGAEYRREEGGLRAVRREARRRLCEEARAQEDGVRARGRDGVAGRNPGARAAGGEAAKGGILY